MDYCAVSIDCLDSHSSFFIFYYASKEFDHVYICQIQNPMDQTYSKVKNIGELKKWQYLHVQNIESLGQTNRAGRYTGSYRIPVFIFLTIWIFKIPQYRCHLNNVWNATLLERGLFSLLHFGEDTAVCVTKRESSETEALVECDEREVIHNIHIDRHKYPPSAASVPASLTN